MISRPHAAALFLSPRSRHARSALAAAASTVLAFLLMTEISQATSLLAAGPLFNAPYLSFDPGVSAQSIGAADVDGDGRVDLVASGSGLGSVLRGSGDGMFSTSFVFVTCAGPAIAIADLDQDGSPDLASAGGLGVCIAYNRGEERYLIAAEYSTHPQATSIAIGDLNHDGFPDIAETFQSVGFVTVLYGSRTGAFGNKRDFVAPAGRKRLEMGDLNGDSLPDLVVTISESSSVVIFLGGEGGTLIPRGSYSVGPQPNDLEIGDLSGDGIVDLAITSGASNSVSILLGTGTGDFVGRQDWNVGFPPTSVVVGDHNGDGRLDIAVGSSESGVISVLLGAGGGVFPTRTDYYASRGLTSLIAQDLNDDKILDLAVGSGTLGNVEVLLGNGDGSFGVDNKYQVGRDPIAIVASDFNRDGIMDLAVANRQSHSISISLGSGGGRFRQRSDVDGSVRPYAVTAGDWNGDAYPDLGVTFDQGVLVLISDGHGGVRSRAEYLVGEIPKGIASADVNGDSFLDLLVANPSRGALTILLGRGDGSFDARSTGIGYIEQGPLVTAEFNGDGNVDVAIGRFEYPGYVSVLCGNGDGTFGCRQDIPTTPGDMPGALATGDLNADGKADLVSSNFYGATVMVLLGNGDGTFLRAPTISMFSMKGTEAVGISDFDNDGKPDLAIGSARSVQIRVGDGAGDFRPVGGYGTSAVPISIAIADFNGDCQSDIAAVRWADGEASSVSILTNRAKTTLVQDATATIRGEHRVIPIGAGAPFLCVEVSPIGNAFDVSDVDLSTVLMRSPGTGAVETIPAVTDREGDGGIPDDSAAGLSVCFRREHLARLFSLVRGRLRAEVTIEGCLFGGGNFLASLELEILGRRNTPTVGVRSSAAYPHGVLHYTTSRPGGVRVNIYDIAGRLIGSLLDEPYVQEGEHEIPIRINGFGPSAIPSGIYFYKIEAADGISTGRFTVLK